MPTKEPLQLFRTSELPLQLADGSSAICSIELFVSAHVAGSFELGSIGISIYEFVDEPKLPSRLLFHFPAEMWSSEDPPIDYSTYYENWIDLGARVEDTVASLLSVWGSCGVTVGATVRSFGRDLYRPTKENQTVKLRWAKDAISLIDFGMALQKLKTLNSETQRHVGFSARLFRKGLYLKPIDIEVSFVILVSALETIAQLKYPNMKPTSRIERLLKDIDPEILRGTETTSFDEVDMKKVARKLYDVRSSYLHEAIPFADRIREMTGEDGFCYGGVYTPTKRRPDPRNPGNTPAFDSVVTTVLEWDRFELPTWSGLVRLTRHAIANVWTL